eukprot:TRINITY_DN56487_c0_g1_i1.p1 TRINITY_DN56487_c0_g1~~TRINITY_DN56487_c0_g1_i1.p1  ORF type:complete len:227 (+),score=32.73 TRINITY_DN56487_c0_g1_i1:61-741(+)
MVSASAQQVTPQGFSNASGQTRRCRFFGMGMCTRGEACKFVHATAGARPTKTQFGTKLCPTLLKTGTSVDDTCDHAHRHEDLQTKQKKKPRRKKRSPGQRSRSHLNTSSFPPQDTLLHLLDDGRKRKSNSGVSTASGSPAESMVKRAAPSFENGVTLNQSWKGVETPQATLHEGLLVVVKRTFIHVEQKDPSIIGIRRAATAPGSITDKLYVNRASLNRSSHVFSI